MDTAEANGKEEGGEKRDYWAEAKTENTATVYVIFVIQKLF